MMIEIIQLVLFLGTFQISDLVQNTLGGIIGGLLYWTVEKRKQKRRLNADEKT